VGMVLILLCTIQWHTISLYSHSSTDCIHGILSVVLYWHFVDAVWVSVVYIVYCGQLVLVDRYVVTQCTIRGLEGVYL
jgi:heme/copper-type cytochrome/quinol oxidase subunit 3